MSGHALRDKQQPTEVGQAGRACVDGGSGATPTLIVNAVGGSYIVETPEAIVSFAVAHKFILGRLTKSVRQ